MKFVRNYYNTTAAAESFISRCESDFERCLDAAAVSVTSDESVRLISLSGPTCSGKTTTARKLISELEQRNKHAIVVSIDDFYRNFENRNFDEHTDFETASALDLDYLDHCILSLLRGNETLLPRYDFTTGRRTSYLPVVPSEDDVFLLEGIQAVYPEVHSMFPEKGTRDIFISVFDGLCVDGVEFTKDELRLCRRVVRDNNFRNTGASGTSVLWSGVRRNEETSIFPNVSPEAVKVDSLMPYEAYMMRDIYLSITSDTHDRGSAYESVEIVREKMEAVERTAITPSMLPPDSVYREFLG